MAVTDEVEEPVEFRHDLARKFASEPPAKPPKVTPASTARMLLLLAILAFLGIYVGPSDMASTLLKVVAAVAISAAVFIGANLLFDQTYPRWTFFNVLVGAIGGFLFYAVLECNGLLRQLYDKRVSVAGGGPYDINAWLWGLIGGGAAALVLFLLSAPRKQLARLPIATIGFTLFGVLTAYAFKPAARPRSTGRRSGCASPSA